MIKKEIKPEFDIHPLIASRWSPRSFSVKAVSKKELMTILEAGRWAASCYNWQPWEIVYGLKGENTYDRIMDCLVEFNQSWCKNASALMIGAYKKTNPEGKDNFHALHDLGQFMANASIQAQSMGIAMHQMAGVKVEEAIKEFGFPDDYHVATAIAVGYYGDENHADEQLPDELKEQEVLPERNRKPLKDFVFNGDFKGK